MILYSMLCLALGIYFLSSAIGNWNRFWNYPKTRFYVKLFTRQGARYFYGLMGLGLIILGLLGLLGKIDFFR